MFENLLTLISNPYVAKPLRLCDPVDVTAPAKWYDLIICGGGTAGAVLASRVRALPYVVSMHEY